MTIIVVIIVIAVVILAAIVAARTEEKADPKAYRIQNKIPINQSLMERLNAVTDFDAVKKFKMQSSVLGIDTARREILYMSNNSTKRFCFADLLSVSIIEDGETKFTKSTSRTIGGVIVGGALFGGVGAIIGGTTGGSTQKNIINSLTVKIVIRDINESSIECVFFDDLSLKKGGFFWKLYEDCFIKPAYELKDILTIIIDEEDKKTGCNNNIVSPTSVSDELKKLFELKESGIITDFEFKTLKNNIIKN